MGRLVNPCPVELSSNSDLVAMIPEEIRLKSRRVFLLIMILIQENRDDVLFHIMLSSAADEEIL